MLDIIKDESSYIIVLSLAILLDMISGVIKAGLDGDLKSGEFRKGLLKKVLDYILVVVGVSLDFLLEVDYISLAVLYSLIAMELYSVLENIQNYIPLPESLKNALDLLQKKGDK